MTEPKHTPGAMRAAKLILEEGPPGESIEEVSDLIDEENRLAEIIDHETAAPELLDALHEITKGEGAFSRDRFTHAQNTIDNMKAIAFTAIAKVEAE